MFCCNCETGTFAANTYDSDEIQAAHIVVTVDAKGFSYPAVYNILGIFPVIWLSLFVGLVLYLD